MVQLWSVLPLRLAFHVFYLHKWITTLYSSCEALPFLPCYLRSYSFFFPLSFKRTFLACQPGLELCLFDLWQQNSLLLCFWKGFLKTEQHLWTPETSKAYSWDTLWNSFLNSNSLRFALLKFTMATLLSWKWMEILYFGRYGSPFGQNCPYKNRQVLSEISENICNCISDVMTRWLFHLKMDTYFCLEIKWL